MDLADRQQQQVRALKEQEGWPEDSPWVRPAVEALPRHAFAPDRLWAWDGHAYVPVDRARDPERWADLVYAGPYDSAITQIGADGLPSSSLSCPSIVVDMLDSLMPEPGDRVLELGAGTGWNGALLAYRVGPDCVTSVEVDRALAAEAREHLAAAGAKVAVEVGDGAQGWPAGAPYAGVMATYAVGEVPWAWVAQTRPGGRIVTPWGRLGHVALTVAPDGCSASGWMQGLATFMPARGTGQGLALHQVRGQAAPDVETPFPRDIRPLHEDGSLLFALRVAVPDIRISSEANDGVTIWLHDGRSSWATLVAPEGKTAVAYQGGPRRLVDEVEEAWQAWSAHGAPSLYDYGMTVTPEKQYIFANDPDRGPRWPASARRHAAA